MTSYLVDAIFLVALMATSFSVILMRRELKRLRMHHQLYASALDETGDALTKVGSLIRDLNLQGLSTVHQLIGQIDTARGLVEDLKAAKERLEGENETTIPAIKSDHRRVS